MIHNSNDNNDDNYDDNYDDTAHSFDMHRRWSIDQSLTFVQLMVPSKHTVIMVFHDTVLLLHECQGLSSFEDSTNRLTCQQDPSRLVLLLKSIVK